MSRFLESARLLAQALVVCLAPGAATRAAAAEELRVFAAASLADALAEVGRGFQAASGSSVSFNFGASSDLSRQIRAGAPADLFVSADAAQMDALEREGLLRAGSRRDLLSNTLVVIVPTASSVRVAAARDLLGFRSIALADPQAVPAGVYARAWLERSGLWPELAPRVVPTLHVRAALAAVESENVEAGIVYRTDAAGSTRARIALEVPRAEGPKIVYPVAVLARSTSPQAQHFASYLRTPAARAVFERLGFVWLGGE